ncbi:MAG: hypothetical protein JSV07_00080 [Acidimicrobiia bacterium]|nr:MAG: hypothetical protein JSV07_00080 [Acidimicrobiia bacterium]
MTQTVTVREAGRAATRLALFQFQWDTPPIERLMDRLGVPATVGYYSVRVAPLGDVPPMVAQALMPFFPVPLVAKMVTKAREASSAAETREIVREELDRSADEVFGGQDGLEELVDLAEAAASEIDICGRPLTTAWASYEWETTGGRLFGAATVLREHRGEGHWFAVRQAGLTGDEVHMLSRFASGRDRSGIGHGYRPKDLDRVIPSLERKGLLVDDRPTDRGVVLLDEIEKGTDVFDRDPWSALDAGQMARFVELAGAIDLKRD